MAKDIEFGYGCNNCRNSRNNKCNRHRHRNRWRFGRPIRIALVGAPTSGKSAIFSRLTGVGVISTNYPGTTVETTSGNVRHKGNEFEITDLPGIYSLSATSEDEKITRDFIFKNKPDVLVNVVDATRLESNLFLTLQLLELGFNLVIALNQIDLASKMGLKIDTKKLSKELGVPVVETVAVKGLGLLQILDECILVAKNMNNSGDRKKRYYFYPFDDHLEDSLKNITSVLPEMASKRTIGIKALEQDEEYLKNVLSNEDFDKIVSIANDEKKKIEKAHPGIPIKDAMLRERHAKAGAIAAFVTEKSKRNKLANIEMLDDILTSPGSGLVILALVLFSMMLLVFYIGGIIEEYIVSIFDALVTNPLQDALSGTHPLLRNVILYSMLGIEAGLGIVIPYIGIFYIFIGILEDTGYLSRAALLLDNACHKFGLHGKAIIPIVLAFGCNVPAILATRTLSSKRERILTGIVATLTPCSARTIVILGLVGKFVSLAAAFSLYAFDVAIIVVVGYVLGKYLPGDKTGLVMEIPILRMPDFVGSLKKSWLRMQEFVYVAFPLIVIGSTILGVLSGLELLDDIQNIFEEPSMLILGLPGFAVTALIIGIIRKEMALEMLAVLGGTMIFTEILTPLQMYVFSLVCIIYVPCIATIAMLKREFGTRDAALITTFTIMLAILIGGSVFRILTIFQVF